MARAFSPKNQNLSRNSIPDAERASLTAKTTLYSRPASPALQPALPHSEPTIPSTKVYLRLKLENLLLSPKTRKVLAAHDVQTLGQLCRLSAPQLATLPGIGPHSLSELNETLNYYGVSLAPEHSSKSKGKKHSAPLPLCLPGLEPGESLPVCRACHKPLVSAPISGNFCSAACRQSTRSTKPSLTTVSPSSLQLALCFLPDE